MRRTLCCATTQFVASLQDRLCNTSAPGLCDSGVGSCFLLPDRKVLQRGCDGCGDGRLIEKWRKPQACNHLIGRLQLARPHHKACYMILLGRMRALLCIES